MKLTKCFLLCSLLAAARASAAEPKAEPLPAEVLVVSALPAVFMVQAYGTVDVTFPKKVTLNRARLEKEYSLMAGTSDKATFYWSRILGNPNEYLQASSEMEHWHESHGLFGTGSAFAVDRQGILLTNAHNLQDPPPDALLSDFHSTLSLLQKPIGELLAQLEAEIGAKPASATFMRLHGNLVQWYGSRSHTSGKFKEARVVLKYDFDRVKLDQMLYGKPGHPADYQKILSTVRAQEISASAVVLAKGEAFPGRDVAVIKIVGGLTNPKPPPLVQSTPFPLGPLSKIPFLQPPKREGGELHVDELICLPLADSELVLPGTPVHALGFPGAAFVKDVMSVAARYLVSSRAGEIGQSKPTVTGLSVFEMAADINHGDSGGPVIDRMGRVVAINVAGTGAPGHNLAIPINVARAMLKQAGIDVDPGPLTPLWHDGLRAYAAARYDEAEIYFREIMGKQAEYTGNDFSVNPSVDVRWQSSPRVHPQVVSMWSRCRKAQGKDPTESPYEELGRRRKMEELRKK